MFDKFSKPMTTEKVTFLKATEPLKNYRKEFMEESMNDPRLNPQAKKLVKTNICENNACIRDIFHQDACKSFETKEIISNIEEHRANDCQFGNTNLLPEWSEYCSCDH